MCRNSDCSNNFVSGRQTELLERKKNKCRCDTLGITECGRQAQVKCLAVNLYGQYTKKTKKYLLREMPGMQEFWWQDLQRNLLIFLQCKVKASRQLDLILTLTLA